MIHVAERPLPQGEDGDRAEQVDPVIGGELDGLWRDERHVDADLAEPFHDLLEPLPRVARVDVQAVPELFEAIGEDQAQRRIGGADCRDCGQSILRFIARHQPKRIRVARQHARLVGPEQLLAQRNGGGIRAVERDPLFDFAVLGEAGNHPVEERARQRQANHHAEQEQQSHAPRVVLHQPGLPDQRRRDEAADHGVERRVTAVAKIQKAAAIGLPRGSYQKEAAQGEDERGDVHRRHHAGSSHKRVSEQGDRRADYKTHDVADQKQETDDIRGKAKTAIRFPRACGQNDFFIGRRALDCSWHGDIVVHTL